MARRVFFSFYYQRDIWRTNVVRNSVVLIGAKTAERQYVDYEIEKSIARGNGLRRGRLS